jgi:TonB family protein
MGYQALLFCPDEKTARTITQVLTELDFFVIPCTEPFAAVKKLMGEHFDAVVVDCDNEQNATLLFKSARNTVNNQSSLAVAVVEGQAGVAKAFRIGANLVLTKPINVEQAKGTVRVARGLLRKSEGAKPAPGATTQATKPVPPALAPNVASARQAAPVAPLAKAATTGIPIQKPAPQPTVVASVPADISDSDADLFEMSEDVVSPSIAKPAAQTSAPKVFSAASAPATSAASAPAPAREPRPSASPENKPASTVSEPESPVEGVATNSSAASERISAPAPAFTFGGNVSNDAESAGGGSKKTLLLVAAVVLIAAVGYAVWRQWTSSEAGSVPVRVTAQRATPPATIPQVAPKAAPAAASSISASPASSATSSVQTSTRDSSAAPQATETAKPSSDTSTAASAENAPVHAGKVSAGADSSKPSPSALAANKAPATKANAEPIMIKSGASPVKAAAVPDASAPSMAGIAVAGNGGALPNLMDNQIKGPTPVLQTLNVSQGVSQGLLVKKAQPTYPPNALRLHLEGAVQLLATISKNGDISAVKTLSGDPQLARAATDAVKQWKYKPYLLNGEPVEIQTQITVNFKLPR